MSPRFMALSAALGAACLATVVSPPQAKADEASESTGSNGSNGSKAQAAKKRVAVGKLSGAKPDTARDAILEGLEESDDVRVVGGDDVLPADSSAEKIAEYAQKVGADAVLVGKTSQKAGVWEANIEVRNGKDGSLIESFQVSGRQKKYQSELKDPERFLPAIAQGELEPVLAATAKPKAEEESAEGAPSAAVGATVGGEVGEEPVEASGGRPSPLDLRAGMRLYSRSFRYTDTLADVFPGRSDFTQPLTYNVAAAPMVFGNGDWFPLAHFMGGWPAHIGVTGGYEIGFATNVAYQNRLLDQSHWLWFVGPKIRIPFSTHWLGIFGTFGNHNYSIEGDDTVSTATSEGSAPAAFPDVKYEFIDLGLDAHLRFDELRIGAHAQYRIVNDSGQIGTEAWFPNTSTRGVTFGGEVGWKLTEMFDLMVGLDVLQYGLDFNEVSIDTPKSRVAGGATDRYLSVWAALQFVLPGQEAVVAGTGPGETPTKPKQVPGGKEDFDSFEDF